MNNTIAERFNVSGALVVKLFGSHDRERDAFADAGRPGPRHRRHAPRCTAGSCSSRSGSSRRVGTAVVYCVGGRLAIDGAITLGTIAAFVIYTGQIYQPLTQLTNARVDVLTALVSLRAGVRGARLPAR